MSNLILQKPPTLWRGDKKTEREKKKRERKEGRTHQHERTHTPQKKRYENNFRCKNKIEYRTIFARAEIKYSTQGSSSSQFIKLISKCSSIWKLVIKCWN